LGFMDGTHTCHFTVVFAQCMDMNNLASN
jgi:hypothetical protein